MGPSAIERSGKIQLERYSSDLATQRAIGHFTKGNLWGGREKDSRSLALKGKSVGKEKVWLERGLLRWEQVDLVCFYAEDEKSKEVEAEDTRKNVTDGDAPAKEERESLQITCKSFCPPLKITECTICTWSPNVQFYTYILSGTYLYLLYELSIVLVIWYFCRRAT